MVVEGEPGAAALIEVLVSCDDFLAKLVLSLGGAALDGMEQPISSSAARHPASSSGGKILCK
ncbi:MAG TPA: hypothetical protein VJV79_12230 [Polyangiaceae bacterium]|nr:hypothetical protein [Polyangiaceae bacterium]